MQVFLAVFIPLALLWSVYRANQALNNLFGIRVVTSRSVFAIILATLPLLIGSILLAEGDSRHEEATEFLLTTGAIVSCLLLWRNLSCSGSAAISLGALVVQLVLVVPALPLTGLLMFGLHSLLFG